MYPFSVFRSNITAKAAPKFSKAQKAVLVRRSKLANKGPTTAGDRAYIAVATKSRTAKAKNAKGFRTTGAMVRSSKKVSVYKGASGAAVG